MFLLNASKKALFALAGLLLAGILLALWLTQLVWLESNKSRVEGYANALLGQAESVASNLTQALVELDALPLPACSDDDLAIIRRITFEHRFVKDAGGVNEGAITCSAMWGTLKQPYTLPGNGKTTRNHIRLWREIPNYAIAGSTIDVSASQYAFVVTSPKAFAAFETPPPGLSVVLASPDDHVAMFQAGPALARTESMTKRNTRRCSERFDICVTAQLDNTIFSSDRAGLLAFVSLVGGLLGVLSWYALKGIVTRRHSVSMKLAAAIRSDGIQMAYQPIVQAATGRTLGFEALARWYDKDLGNVPPDVFFKKASELHLGFQLNSNVIRKSLSECGELLRRCKQLYLSVNLDTESLLTPDLIEVLIQETQSNGIDFTQIAIEILEVSTAEVDQIEASVAQLRQCGYQVFIDDFGTGYSSLAYLSNLKIDKIKIDRTFTQSAGTDSPAAQILVKIYEISKTINTEIIFEGIETEEQLEAILVFCPDALAQGWLFSKAIPIEALSVEGWEFPRTVGSVHS